MDSSKEALEYIAGDRFAMENGVKLLSCGHGAARAEVRLEERHKNANGVAQGGLIFTLADTAFALLCNAEGRRAVGLSNTIQFLRPGTGERLTATASMVGSTRSTCCADVIVTDDRDRVVAKMQCTGYYIQ
ncbi:MAG: PaaI family thioesterase [Oscillospiraceae bacterium]|nr:PaaI family thioesterase [Oscillospiraceae bacterium]